MAKTLDEAKRHIESLKQGDALDAFAVIDTTPRDVLDRSTLEAWATCPAQADFIETKQVSVVGELAVAGELAHQAFAAGTRLWVESGMQVSPRDMVLEMENAALGARPDLQPDVLASTRWMLWDWANYLNGVHINNIQGFDGGEEVGKTGQLAMEIAGITYTTEFDFLATIKDEGYDDDFKTGWKEHTRESIQQSFQFQSHAAIAFANFPEMEVLYVRVWNTRKSTTSPLVPFWRKDKGRFEARIAEAVAVRMRGEIETWPTVEKCSICPAASLCPAADAVMQETPESRLLQLIAADAKAEALKKLLTAHVDEHGEIVLPDGTVFGRNKPRSEKKQPVAIYKREA